MKKPVVDYREFRFSRINDPAFSHLKLLWGWVVYFILFFLTENLIPAENCHVIHCRLDDLIPFNEFFLIFYVSWYFLIIGSLLYFMLYDIDSFRRLSIFIMITQAVAMAVYILYPSRQDLRPLLFERNNILTQLMALIYAFDTNTGVFPSLHVAYSLGIASVWWKKKDTAVLWRIFVVLLAVVISIATTFVKQHSALDVLGAVPVALLAEYLIYRRKLFEKKTPSTV